MLERAHFLNHSLNKSLSVHMHIHVPILDRSCATIVNDSVSSQLHAFGVEYQAFMLWATF